MEYEVLDNHGDRLYPRLFWCWCSLCTATVTEMCKEAENRAARNQHLSDIEFVNQNRRKP